MQMCGLDEAGRGALAGPLVAAAVVINAPIAKAIRSRGTKIKDGKLLKSIQREKIVELIKTSGAEIFVEVISTRQINNHGIGWANKEIFRRLIRKVAADRYIVDGNLKIRQARSIVDADATVLEVILAGIVAKVARDELMREIHTAFPHFGWKQNKGYGTQAHIEAIHHHGICRYHRTVFVNTALMNKHHGQGGTGH
jgi:ribonuclease HII